mgnify:CR=1 FL=1
MLSLCTPKLSIRPKNNYVAVITPTFSHNFRNIFDQLLPGERESASEVTRGHLTYTTTQFPSTPLVKSRPRYMRQCQWAAISVFPPEIHLYDKHTVNMVLVPVSPANPDWLGFPYKLLWVQGPRNYSISPKSPLLAHNALKWQETPSETAFLCVSQPLS